MASAELPEGWTLHEKPAEKCPHCQKALGESDFELSGPGCKRLPLITVPPFKTRAGALTFARKVITIRTGR